MCTDGCATDRDDAKLAWSLAVGGSWRSDGHFADDLNANARNMQKLGLAMVQRTAVQHATILCSALLDTAAIGFALVTTPRNKRLALAALLREDWPQRLWQS
jgi:hypothetical protein